MSTYYVAGFPYSDELYHHGIKGQKWGIRRYQNDDGTLTLEGRARYGKGQERKDAKFELSTQRGEKLIDKGRSKAGALGRTVGRQALIEAGKFIADAALTTVGIASLSSPAAFAAITAGQIAANAIWGGATVANAVKGIKDYRDIARGEARRQYRTSAV